MDPDRFAIIGAIGGSLDAATAPVQRFEHMVQPGVTHDILPAFGLFHSRVAIDAPALRALPTAVPLGAMIALVPGKQSVSTWPAGWPRRPDQLHPDGSTWGQRIGSAFLAGIGFAMALFISGLAFAGTHFERGPNWPSWSDHSGRSNRCRHPADVDGDAGSLPAVSCRLSAPSWH